jgi:hypothetical protein
LRYFYNVDASISGGATTRRRPFKPARRRELQLSFCFVLLTAMYSMTYIASCDGARGVASWIDSPQK